MSYLIYLHFTFNQRPLVSSSRGVTNRGLGWGVHLETCQDMLEHELSVALQCMPCGWLPSPPSTFCSNPFYFSFCITLLVIVRIHKVLVLVVFTFSLPHESAHFLRREYIYSIFLTWASTVFWHIKGVWQMFNWIKLLKIISISFFSLIFLCDNVPFIICVIIFQKCYPVLLHKVLFHNSALYFLNTAMKFSLSNA